jgi:hypothetical protein
MRVSLYLRYEEEGERRREKGRIVSMHANDIGEE